METWNKGELNNSITKVLQRLKPVLCNILEAKGANDLLETKRGEEYSKLKVEDVMFKLQYDNNDTFKDLLCSANFVKNEDNDAETEFEEGAI